MDNQKMSLLFNAKLSSFEKLNDQFLKAKCYVMALGKNVNKSHFSKENVDKAYPTLSFVPVIGHLMSDDNDNYYLGGHDVKLDISSLTLKSMCVPFGVAIPTPEPVYEDVIENNGTKSTYLTTEVVLWIGRYPELAEAIYSEDVYFGQSMEILYSNSASLEDDPAYTDIIDFSFDALCLLGKSDDSKFNVVPCFPSAAITPITYSIDKENFSSLMNEMKEQLSFCMINNDEKGGNILDEKNVILQKYGKTIEELDFSIDDLSVEEFKEKMEELFGENETKTEPVAFSATYKQKHEALRNALDPIIIKDSNGKYVEETYFYVSDFDDEYVYVEVNHWSATGDYDCKYGRRSYTFDDTTITATIADDFVEMIQVWMTLEEKEKLDADRVNYETISTEFEFYKKDHIYTNADYEALKTFKETKESEERKTREDSLFEKFEKSIGGTDEFKELKVKAGQFSIEDLKKECLCIVGLYATAKEQNEPLSTGTNTIKFSIETPPSEDDEPYGGLMKKYLGK